jgi:hypothetical protein
MSENRVDATSFVLGFTRADDTLFHEEFLRFTPGRLMSGVIRHGRVMSIEDIDQTLRQEGGINIVLYLPEDVFRLADRLREWAPCATQVLPPFLNAEVGVSPIALSRANLTFFPPIDRTWHNEWPIRVDLRPTTAREKLEHELKYWRHIKDDGRAGLLEERLFQAGSAT